MPNGQQTNIPISQAFAKDDTIAGKPLKFYWRVARWFIILLVILDIGMIVIDRWLYLHWVFEAVIFLMLSFVISRIYESRLNTAMAAGIFTGFIAGFLIAVFEIIWYHEWWTLLNVIARPLWMGLGGSLVAGIFGLIFQNILKKDKI